MAVLILRRLAGAAVVALLVSGCSNPNAHMIEALQRAEQGDLEAQLDVGAAYESGRYGVRPDAAESVYWYRKAAGQGDAEAQLYLGFAYEGGEGVKKDVAQAAKWYRQSANQGNSDSMERLSWLYLGLDGDGVSEDRVEAFKWFILEDIYHDEAAPPESQTGFELSRELFEEFEQGREEFRKIQEEILLEHISPEEREEADRLAREFFEAHPPD